MQKVAFFNINFFVQKMDISLFHKYNGASENKQ